MNSYPLDYFAVIFLLSMVVVGVIELASSAQKHKKYKNAKKLIIGGVSIFFFLIVLNSSVEHRWDFDYILSFVCLKKASATAVGDYRRFVLAVSYLFIIMGILQLFFKPVPSFEKNKSIMDDGTDIQKKMPKNTKNEYVNARFDSMVLQYAMMTAIFLIGPLALLYFLIGLLINTDYLATGVLISMVVTISIVWIGLVALFFYLKKYWVFKIVTDSVGLTYLGLLKKIDARWDQILSIKVTETNTGYIFGKEMAEVETSNGLFYFPLMMKRNDDIYLKLDLLGEQWVNSDGSKKPISEEHCSLYMEIKEHLGKG